MKKIYIYLSVTLFFIISACSNISDIWKECNWVNDTNGIKLWTPINEDATTYTWKGQSWNSYAHGKGTITIYDANNNIIKQDTATAYYGAMSKWHIKDVPNGKYVGEVYEKTMDGFGILVKKDSIFVGQFKNSIPNGRLDWYVNNRLCYTGNWENGSFNGEGTLYKEDGTETTGIWKNGAIYEKMVDITTEVGHYYGYMVDGKPSRRGIMEYADSSVYDGEWKNGKFDGEGIFCNNKDSIAGEWAEGKLDGYATHISEDFSYQGEYIDGVPYGYGTVLFADSTFYSGWWENGKKSGYGDLLYPNDDFYFGDWLNDLQDGYGTYYYANGDSYVGQWESGLQHGEGTYTSATFKYTGNWEEGWINGEGRMDYSNGDYYEGNFVENQRYGVGVYHSATGNVYEGEFVDGTYNGLGVYHFNDGSIYEGEFEDGKIKGDGTFYCIIDKDTLAITAFWDGTNNLPKNVSILFSGGYIYESSIVNGKISPNGSWYDIKDASKISNNNEITLRRINEGLKKASIALEKASDALFEIQVALNTLSLVPIPIVQPITACAAKVVNTVAPTVYGLDMFVTTVSFALDTYVESKENHEDFVENISKDAAMILVPKLIHKVTRKLKIPLSESALKKKIAPTIIKISKTKPLKSVVQVTKDSKGKLTKKLATSKLSTFLHRLTGRQSHQFVSSKQYRRALARNPELKSKLKLGKKANGQTLRYNMEVIGGKKMKKRNIKEKKLSNWNNQQRSEAHHVVPGNSQTAQRARDILACCNIDINDPRNGIMLPKNIKSIHKGTIHGKHIPKYEDTITEMLENMLKKNGGKCSERDCEQILDLIKIGLYKGNIQLLRDEKHKVNKTRIPFRRRI